MLRNVDPRLAAVPELATEEDRAEELAYAHDCLMCLQTVYAEARQQGQVVVCERLETASDF